MTNRAVAPFLPAIKRRCLTMTAAGEDDAKLKARRPKKKSGPKPFVNVGSVAFAVACFFWRRDECEPGE